MVRTKNSRLIMQSKCHACGIKKSRKEHEAKVLLSNLGIKTPLSKIPLLNVLFLVGDKFARNAFKTTWFYL